MNNIIIEIVKCKIMKLINRETIFLCSFFIVLYLISSCEQVKPLKNTTDCDNMNLKSNVCLVIQENFDVQDGKETNSNTIILKFNHLKNLLKKIKGKEITSYSYDDVTIQRIAMQLLSMLRTEHG